MRINLGREFTRSLDGFVGLLRNWQKDSRRDLERAMKRIGQRHKKEAVERVPVDTSALKQRILTNTFEHTFFNYVTETGTNVRDYPIFLEFGTKYIAGGRVKAIGDKVEVTDAEAVRLWPAKNFGTLNTKTGERTGGIVDERSGIANKAAVAALDRRREAGKQDEQMPWLRTSFSKIREWAIKQIEDAMKPPGAK